jgi:hypothetical protein
MDKETLVARKAEAENNCRVLYDQLETAKSQIAQIEVELERSRGDFRTYDKLVSEWQDPAPTPAYPLVPADANRIERVEPSSTPSPKKEKQHV